MLGPIKLSAALPDGNNDGKIVSSGTRPYLGPKGTVWIYKPNLAAFTYWPQGYSESAPPASPPPTPPAPPPPSPPTGLAAITQLGNEVFMKSAALSAGLNAGGALGTIQNAPAGFPSDSGHGYLRVGLVTIPQVGADAMLKGTPIEGFVVAYKLGTTPHKLVNAPRTGVTDLRGVASTSTEQAYWLGANERVKVRQIVSMSADGKALTFDVKITNTGTDEISDVRYMRVIDPDQNADSGIFTTVNTITAGNKVRAVASGVTLTLGTDDPRATAAIKAIPTNVVWASDPYAIVPQAVGYTHTGDDTLHLSFALGDLAAGTSTSAVFTLGMAAG